MSAKRMEIGAGSVKRIASRFAYGAAIYWALNVALLAAELRWHILYRLTLWDIQQLRALAPVLTRLMHR